MPNEVLYSFWFTIICVAVCLTEEKNCLKGGIEVCCSNFERVDSSCKECKIGSTSVEGGNCSKCKLDWYGYKCASLCNCTPNTRCDSVKGCVDFGTHSTYEAITRSNDADEATSSHTRRTERFGISAVFSDADGSTLSNRRNTEIYTFSTGESTSRYLRIYCVVIACLLLFLYFGFGLYRHRHSTKHKLSQQFTDIDSPSRGTENLDENIELEEIIYQDVDENRMERSNE